MKMRTGEKRYEADKHDVILRMHTAKMYQRNEELNEQLMLSSVDVRALLKFLAWQPLHVYTFFHRVRSTR